MNNTDRPFFTTLAILKSKLTHFLSAHNHLHEAAFARLDQIAHLLSTIDTAGDSLLIGKTATGNHVLSVHPTPKRPKLGNTLVVVPTQGGKSLLAISQLLTWKYSVIVNDIKGELTRYTSGWRNTFSTVYVLDPTGRGNRFNPLDGLTTEDKFYSLATQLLFTPDEGEGAHFSLGRWTCSPPSFWQPVTKASRTSPTCMRHLP
jgi:type IV secretory pathway TraG/TraD family ATPase VirD4